MQLCRLSDTDRCAEVAGKGYFWRLCPGDPVSALMLISETLHRLSCVIWTLTTAPLAVVCGFDLPFQPADMQVHPKKLLVFKLLFDFF